MPKDDWDAKVDRAVKNRYRPDEDLKGLLAIVKSHRGLQKVFADLATNSSFQKLLFAQPAEILAAEGDLVLAFLPHASKTSIRKAAKGGKVAIAELVEEQSVGVAFHTLLGLDEKEWERLGSDIKEIVAYFIIAIIRSVPEMRQVVAADKFDYEQFRAALKNVNQENLAGVEQAANALMEIGREVNQNSEVLHPAIAQKVANIGDVLVNHFARNMDDVALNLNKVFPNFVSRFALVSDTWVTRILSRTDLTSAQYEDALDLLFRRELLTTQSVMTWCMGCSKDNPTFSHRHGHIPPSRVSDSICWNCKDPESFGAFYQIVPELRKIMFHRDGLLGVYLAWLLEENGIRYKASTHSKEFENDYIINDDTLVEVKMFRRGREQRLVDASLKEAFAQLAKVFSPTCLFVATPNADFAASTLESGTRYWMEVSVRAAVRRPARAIRATARMGTLSAGVCSAVVTSSSISLEASSRTARRKSVRIGRIIACIRGRM